jgi:hypothetical protein
MPDKPSDRFPPSITAAKLYERTSAKGNPYLIGRWGNLRVAVLKTQERDDDGNAIWDLRLSPASSNAKRQAQAAEQSAPTRELTYTAVDPDAADDVPPSNVRDRTGSGFGAPAFGADEIPF